MASGPSVHKAIKDVNRYSIIREILPGNKYKSIYYHANIKPLGPILTLLKVISMKRYFSQDVQNVCFTSLDILRLK